MDFDSNDFNPDDYVRPGGPGDRFNGGPSVGAICPYCGKMMLLRPDEDPFCDVHRN